MSRKEFTRHKSYFNHVFDRELPYFSPLISPATKYIDEDAFTSLCMFYKPDIYLDNVAWIKDSIYCNIWMIFFCAGYFWIN